MTNSRFGSATKSRKHEKQIRTGFVFSCFRGCFVCLAAFLYALALPPLGAQEPTFRGGTRTVAVYASVTGPDGRLVPDLPRESFTIQDNGKPQPITLFA